MRKEIQIDIPNIERFKKKVFIYANRYKIFAFLDSNDFNQQHSPYSYYEYDFLAALGAIRENQGDYFSFSNQLNLNTKNRDWLFGFLSYDLKNEFENLESQNTDHLDFPAIHFFTPEIVIRSKNSRISFLYFENQYTEEELLALIKSIECIELTKKNKKTLSIELKQRFKREAYIETVKKLKSHIQQGDIYEINFCHEFYCKTVIDPIASYTKLNNISPTPFSCFYKLNDKYLLSASPERFLKKKGTKIISQPIKGTIKRGKDEDEDLFLKTKLLNDPKEKAENVMIVDLVRNDLSHTALKKSVQVEELYGIYSFKQVHHMISTIVSEVNEDTCIGDILKNAFPMGSMTGAPKIRAMQLIEDYEKTKRGLYSGSVGFITPDNDFDFNVVIRSILYNETKKYVSFTVGGAITSLSDPEQEYEESMLKAEAMIKVFN